MPRRQPRCDSTGDRSDRIGDDDPRERNWTARETPNLHLAKLQTIRNVGKMNFLVHGITK
jgi:hypothetical protein